MDSDKLYTISDKSIIWETEIDGEISQIHINKNGYFYKITPVGFSPTGDFYL